MNNEALDMFEIDGRLLRASFGTTKYCSFFLKGLQCKNKECLYMHSSPKSSKIFTKEMMSNKAMYLEQEQIAYKLADIEKLPLADFLASIKKFCKGTKPAFPAPEYIYHKKFIFLESTLYELQNESQPKVVDIEIKKEINKPEPPNKIQTVTLQNNKFKFIKLNLESNTQETSQLINEDGDLGHLLDEMHYNETQEYYNRYPSLVKCMSEEESHKQRPAHATQFNGTPIYSWAYQKINNYAYAQVSCITQDSQYEWKKEQYHIIKQLLSNTNERWLFDECRGIKRYVHQLEKINLMGEWLKKAPAAQHTAERTMPNTAMRSP